MLYIIRNEHGFIWSNEDGWVDAGSVPTIFTQDDYQTFALPVSAKYWWEVLDLRLPGQKAQPRRTHGVCTMDWNKLTRLEVITEDGRQLVVRFNVRGIWPEVQDDGRTLKLYISSKKD